MGEWTCFLHAAMRSKVQRQIELVLNENPYKVEGGQ